MPGQKAGPITTPGCKYHVDNGSTWVYDTATDGALPNGFRFDGSGRYIIFDQASNGSGNVFYDSFSISSTYAPRAAGRARSGRAAARRTTTGPAPTTGAG